EPALRGPAGNGGRFWAWRVESVAYAETGPKLAAIITLLRPSPTDMRPTWAEISLTALRHNFRTILDYVAPNATVCAVVKADAYGHGAADCAKALEAEGATWFGVTGPDEGIRLRQ